MERCHFVLSHDIDYWNCTILSTFKVCRWSKRMLVSNGFKSLPTFGVQKEIPLGCSTIMTKSWSENKNAVYIWSTRFPDIWMFGLVGMVAWTSLRWPDPCLRIVPRSEIDASLGKPKSLAWAEASPAWDSSPLDTAPCWFQTSKLLIMELQNLKTLSQLHQESWSLSVKTQWNHIILYLTASQTTCLPSSIEKIRAVASGWHRHQVALLSFWMSWTSQGPVRPQNCTGHCGVGSPATNERKVALTLPSKLVQMRHWDPIKKHAASFISQCVVLFAISCLSNPGDLLVTTLGTGLGCGPRRFLYPFRWSHISNLSLHSLEEVGGRVEGFDGIVLQKFSWEILYPTFHVLCHCPSYVYRYHDTKWTLMSMCAVCTRLYALFTSFLVLHKL